MLWLLYGSNGWIGERCREILQMAGQKVVSGKRITSLKDVEDDVVTHKPDRVICAIGRTYGDTIPNIDYLEKPGILEINLRDNLLAPLYIAQATTQGANLLSSIPTLYFGSGCIYEYSDPNNLSHPFEETDPPNFFGSAYSAVKSATDQLINGYPHVLNADSSWITLEFDFYFSSARIRMPIYDDPSPRDFITKILGYRKITSLPNSMTVMSDILPLLLALTHEGKFGGRVNACNKGWVDHDWILKKYAEKTGEKLDYVLEPINEQKERLAARRSNNTLSTDKLDHWTKILPFETKKLYYAPIVLPELTKSIEDICAQRALMFSTTDSTVTRNLLVTGGCGFIGSNFINHWLKKYPNDTVINIDRLDPCSNSENIDTSVSTKYKLVAASINNKDLVLHLMKQYQVTHLVHFAGSCHETATLNPTNPYAATKAAAEFLVKSYGESFKLNYVRNDNI
ncbi:unnamed protein product [Didymodactylos carnosus]|uniref:NAD(P)-binding domain-containing protein n=1 Tax=Didymodactylos carnosus TaxID=1234261 RepID=A0A814M6A6_9BILA|nr:unnamed protein product [Didymodactylos carnosus]CAF3841839.1 unnamed protein product [Didymodactylos carnosus]